jgi:hypothetical protein
MSSVDESIARLRGMLANADLVARCPDGGEKMRKRLESLLALSNATAEDGAGGGGASSSSAAAEAGAGSNLLQQHEKSNEATAEQKRLRAAQEHQLQLRGLGGIKPFQMSPSTSLADVLHRTFDNILPKAEVARLCGEQPPPQPVRADNSRAGAGAAAAAATAAAAGSSSSPSSAAGSVSSDGAIAKKSQQPTERPPVALKLLSWEETLRAKEQMLEEERAAELDKIRSRMQMFEE